MLITIPNNSNKKLSLNFELYQKIKLKNNLTDDEKIQLKKLEKSIFTLSKTSGFSKKEFEKLKKKFFENFTKEWKIENFESFETIRKFEGEKFELSYFTKTKTLSPNQIVQLAKKLQNFDLGIRILFHSKKLKIDFSNYDFFSSIIQPVFRIWKDILENFAKNKQILEGILFAESTKYIAKNLSEILSATNLEIPEIVIGEFPKLEDFENLKFFIQNFEEIFKKEKRRKILQKNKSFEILKNFEIFDEKEDFSKYNSKVLQTFFEKENLFSDLKNPIFKKVFQKIEIDFDFLNQSLNFLNLKKFELEISKKFQNLISSKTSKGEFLLLKKELINQKVFYSNVFKFEKNIKIEISEFENLKNLTTKDENFSIVKLISAWNQFFYIQKKIISIIDSHILDPEISEVDSVANIFGSSYDFIQIKGTELAESGVNIIEEILENFGNFSSQKLLGRILFEFLENIEEVLKNELKNSGENFSEMIFGTNFQKILPSSLVLKKNINPKNLDEIQFLKFKISISFLRHYKKSIKIIKSAENFSEQDLIAFKILLRNSRKIINTLFQFGEFAFLEYQKWIKFLDVEEDFCIKNISLTFLEKKDEIKKKIRPFSVSNLYVPKNLKNVKISDFINDQKFFYESFENLELEFSKINENYSENFANSFFYLEVLKIFSEGFLYSGDFKNFENEKSLFESIKAKLEDRLSKIRESSAFKNISYYSHRISNLYFKIFALSKTLNSSENKNEKRSYTTQIEGSAIPKKYKKDLLGIAKIIDSSESSSGSTMTERNYLDTLLSFPWNSKNLIDYDIKKIAKTFDNLQYSFSVPKQKILDDIATIKVSNGKIQPSIICLAGPPGTGKTFFAQNLAKAIESPFEKISLAGLDDASVLVGQRRGWVGAHTGKIVKSMILNKTKNIVFLLDEIDKIGGKSMNSKATESVLLDILDQEQNSEFSDLFMEIPVDISKCWFVATANELENISAPLLDRMEVLEVVPYTDDEKMKIAKDYILPELISENFIDIKKVIVQNEVFDFLISEYGNIDGFRTIKKILKSALRHANFSLLSGKKKISVDVKFTKEIIWKIKNNRFGFDS